MQKQIEGEESDDPFALLQWVLREAYLENLEDVRYYAEKIQFFNECKKAIRNYLASLRSYKSRLLSVARDKGIDICRGNGEDREAMDILIEEYALDYEVKEIDYELCIPNRVPSVEVKNLASLDAEIAHWEEQLNTLGDDAQLAQVDLQNWTQKVQQSLTMLSNLSKSQHDAIMAIIRNIKS
jgi:hypothetical protein